MKTVTLARLKKIPRNSKRECTGVSTGSRLERKISIRSLLNFQFLKNFSSATVFNIKPLNFRINEL